MVGYGIRYEFGLFTQSFKTANRLSRPTIGCATDLRGR
ncbi:MAG: hypothetical protein ACLUKN_03710 [Bacilli bacterium]